MEIADSMIVDFCSILGGFEAGMPIVDQQFKKAGVNFIDPTKKELLKALDNLVKVSEELHGQDIAKRELNKFVVMLNKFE